MCEVVLAALASEARDRCGSCGPALRPKRGRRSSNVTADGPPSAFDNQFRQCEGTTPDDAPCCSSKTGARSRLSVCTNSHPSLRASHVDDITAIPRKYQRDCTAELTCLCRRCLRSRHSNRTLHIDSAPVPTAAVSRRRTLSAQKPVLRAISKRPTGAIASVITVNQSVPR